MPCPAFPREIFLLMSLAFTVVNPANAKNAADKMIFFIILILKFQLKILVSYV